MEEGNSGNHEKDGQNVLYGDGRMSRRAHRTPSAVSPGTTFSPIRTTASTRPPVSKDDSLLLPTDDQ